MVADVVVGVLLKERDDLDEKLRQQMKMVQDSQQRCRQTLSEMADVNDRWCLQTDSLLRLFIYIAHRHLSLIIIKML